VGHQSHDPVVSHSLNALSMRDAKVAGCGCIGSWLQFIYSLRIVPVIMQRICHWMKMMTSHQTRSAMRTVAQLLVVSVFKETDFAVVIMFFFQDLD
jgi:hypothetical protein